ncbi:MAG: phage tail sheath subtilisin-like domain-containing protein [Spirochaetaceae bacterium]|nr:phage tail sheath subtilisin-like domain-containing protein [Spirochaetaceae bacterium]
MMSPVVPGVYVEEKNFREYPLRLGRDCLTGFVGIAERGPLHEPVEIASWDAYRETFGGFETPGNLPLSVFGYFQCGGSRCVVVRAADENASSKARLHLRCAKGGSILLEASSPGAWGNHITARIWHGDGDFSLSLSYRKKTETFPGLSVDPHSERYFAPYITARSRLCRALGENPRGLPRPCFAETAQGGVDGIADMGPRDFIGAYHGPGNYRGLGALECREDIALIAAPDISWLFLRPGKSKQEKEADFFAVQAALVNQAERFPGRFAVLDAPPQADALEAASWARRFDSAAAALYYPAIDVLAPSREPGRIPPSGAICGCIAAQDAEKGVFHAPANIRLSGATGTAARPSPGEEEFLFSARVNLLKYFPGRGVKIWGCSTLSENPAWKYINVRRAFSRIAQSIKTGTQGAVFEPNTVDLRKRLVRQVSGFLLDLWREGCLAGATPEEAFRVRCDEELNPPENIEQGIICFEAGVAIARPAEFFRIFITAEKDGERVYVKEE